MEKRTDLHKVNNNGNNGETPLIIANKNRKIFN